MKSLGRIFYFVWSIIRQIAVWLWQAARWLAPRIWSLSRRFALWIWASPGRRKTAAILLLVTTLVIGYRVLAIVRIQTGLHSDAFAIWFAGSPEQRAALVTTRREPCPGAPFLLPTDGFIGLLYGDPRLPYSETRPHQGLDIFSLGEPGATPVYAAYDGYVTRLTGWTSALILRVPDDPLMPGRQLWLYYTHMAPADGSADFIADAFYPGASEVFVEQGTLLGYTGDYAGDAPGISTHLHFSIVIDDGAGSFTNELYFDNTVDPSRYLGMAVNYACAADTPTCTPDPLCSQAILSASGG